MIKVHITLDEKDFEDLRKLSLQTRRPKSRLIREAVGIYIAANRRHALRERMRRYADKLAGSSADIIAETDAHVTEKLLRETTW